MWTLTKNNEQENDLFKRCVSQKMFKSFVNEMFQFLPTEPPKRKPEGRLGGEPSLKKQRELTSEEKHLDKLKRYFKGLQTKNMDKTNEFYLELGPILVRAASEVSNPRGFWDLMLDFQAALAGLESEDGKVVEKINKLVKWSTIPAAIQQRLAEAARLEAEAEDARLEAEAEAKAEAARVEAARLEAKRIRLEAESKESIEAESKESSASGNRRRKRRHIWRPRPGDDVMVQLNEHVSRDFKKSSFYKELKKKNRPVRLTIEQIGDGTYTFIRKRTKQGKPISVAVPIDGVIVEPASAIEPPKALDDGMLIEVYYEEYSDWYVLRYRALNPPVVTEDKHDLDASEIYSFSQDEDEWRFPEYMTLGEGDIIECFVMGLDGVYRRQTLEVMERIDEHRWMCELKENRSKIKAENEIEIDIYRTQVRLVGDAKASSESEEYSESEVESDDDRTYAIDDVVDYHGHRYKIIGYLSETDTYTLKPKAGGVPLELAAAKLENQWSHDFEVGQEVMFEGRRAEITGIHWTRKEYVIRDADDMEHTTLAVGAYTPLAYDIGRHVVYAFQYCEIVDLDEVNLTYTLAAGSDTFDGISEAELNTWCLFQKEDQPPKIYKIVRRLQKSVKRGGKGKQHTAKVPYYKLLSEEESVKQKPKLKDAVATDSGNVKRQEDVEAIYQDVANATPEDLGAIFQYSAGDRVSYNDREATVVRQTVEDEYEIRVDGEAESRVVPVADLMNIEPDVEDPTEVDKTRYEEGDYKYEDGEMWKVTSISRGRLHWEVVDPVTDHEIEDFEGTLWEYDDYDGWRHADDDPSDDTDEDDVEYEYQFSVGDIVYVDDAKELYRIAERSAAQYTIESVSHAEHALENVSEDRLLQWTPAFEDGNEVVVGDSYEKRVITEVGDGLYMLDDGTEVAESDLSKYIQPIRKNRIVKVSGRRPLYRVKTFVSGTYTLVRLVDGETFEVGIEEVDEREEPEFQQNEWVVVSGEQDPCQVKRVDAQKGTYTLSDKRILFESELREAPDPKFGRFNGEKFVPDTEQLVSVGDEGVRLKIKRILRATRQYVLEDGRTVSEDELHLYADDN